MIQARGGHPSGVKFQPDWPTSFLIGLGLGLGMALLTVHVAPAQWLEFVIWIGAYVGIGIWLMRQKAEGRFSTAFFGSSVAGVVVGALQGALQSTYLENHPADHAGASWMDVFWSFFIFGVTAGVVFGVLLGGSLLILQNRLDAMARARAEARAKAAAERKVRQKELETADIGEDDTDGDGEVTEERPEPTRTGSEVQAPSPDPTAP